jgi:hypothetical protein
MLPARARGSGKIVRTHSFAAVLTKQHTRVTHRGGDTQQKSALFYGYPYRQGSQATRSGFSHSSSFSLSPSRRLGFRGQPAGRVVVGQNRVGASHEKRKTGSRRRGTDCASLQCAVAAHPGSKEKNCIQARKWGLMCRAYLHRFCSALQGKR